jgi:hypothetical protein
MKCPTDGILRCRIDQELTAPELESVDEHLRSCSSCRARLADISGRSNRIRDILNILSAANRELSVNPATPYAQFHQSFASSMNAKDVRPRRLFTQWKRPVWGVLAAASAVALLVSFAPARTWGQKILDMLRVQKVAVVPIDMSAVGVDGTDSSSAGKLVAQMISDSVVVTMKPGEPQTAATVEVASQMAGFTVRTLSELGTPDRILIEGEGAFHMTLDRDRILDVLDQAGRSDIQIPGSVNGSTVAVHLPKVVRLVYGTCPSGRPVQGDAAGPKRSGDVAADTCVSFFQVPSPTVSVPPTLNIAALAEAGLQVAGMGAAEAHAFCQTVDWSSTLVVPVPRTNSSSRTVPVDGVNGTLIETAPHGKLLGEYALLWVKDGIVYSVSGIGNVDRALSAAEALN